MNVRTNLEFQSSATVHWPVFDVSFPVKAPIRTVDGEREHFLILCCTWDQSFLLRTSIMLYSSYRPCYRYRTLYRTVHYTGTFNMPTSYTN